jgi:hypothetical protein
MSVSQNKKNEQQNNLCTTLTEQWKKGELEVGEYYLRYKDGTIDREYYDYANVYDLMVEKGFSTESCDISEVLAPVPSYEEWQELNKQRNQFIRDIKDLAHIQEENQQLDERLLDMMDLLQKCYFYLNAVADGKVKTEYLEQIKTLAVLIDNAIGEK